MPIPIDTYRSVKRLNWIFARSAVLLLAIAGRSIIQDFEKDWRKPQQAGKVWQAALVEEKIERETTPEKQARLAELQSSIAQQQTAINAKSDEIGKLKE